MKLIALILLSLVSTVLFSQQFRTTVSDEYENKASFNYNVALGENHYHLLRTQKAPSVNMSIGVRKTDKTDRVVAAETAERIKVREPMGVKFEVFGHRLYIIYQEMDKKGIVGNIMAAEVDTSTLVIGEPRMIGDLGKAGYQARVSPDDTRGYRFFWKSSPDQQKVMAMVTNDKTASEFFVAVFDRDLRLLWQKKETLASPSNMVSQKDACVDNNGNVYVAYRIVPPNNGRGTPGELNRLAIYNSTGLAREHKLNLGSSTAHDIRLLASANGKLVHVAGYYFEKEFQALRGVFASTVETGLELGPINKTDFPPVLVEQFANDRWATKQGEKYGLFAVLFTKLMEIGDHSLVMTGEFRSTDQGTRGNLIQYSGSLLNVYFAGSTASFARIPKYRVSQGSTVGDSFSAFPYKENVVIFYNDNQENLSKDISLSPVNSNVYSNVVMVAAIISPTGAVTRNIVVDLRKENYVAITNNIQRIGNTFFVPNYKVKTLGGIKDDFRLATVELY